LSFFEVLRVEETLCLCSSSSIEEDHLDLRSYLLSPLLPLPSSTSRLWEEVQTSAAKRGVGDRNGNDDDNGDSEGGEGIQTVSCKDILFYD